MANFNIFQRRIPRLMIGFTGSLFGQTYLLLNGTPMPSANSGPAMAMENLSITQIKLFEGESIHQRLAESRHFD